MDAAFEATSRLKWLATFKPGWRDDFNTPFSFLKKKLHKLATLKHKRSARRVVLPPINVHSSDEKTGDATDMQTRLQGMDLENRSCDATWRCQPTKSTHHREIQHAKS